MMTLKPIQVLPIMDGLRMKNLFITIVARIIFGLSLLGAVSVSASAQDNPFDILSLKTGDNLEKFELVIKTAKCQLIQSSYFSQSLPNGQIWYYLTGAECLPKKDYIGEDIVVLSSSPLTGSKIYLIGNGIVFKEDAEPPLSIFLDEYSKKYGKPTEKLFDEKTGEFIFYWAKDGGKAPWPSAEKCVISAQFRPNEYQKFNSECGTFFALRIGGVKEDRVKRVFAMLIDAELANTLKAEDSKQESKQVEAQKIQ